MEDTTNTDNTQQPQQTSEQPLPPTKETPSVIEQARAENDRKEGLLKQEAELLDRKEKLHAEQLLSGRSGAGQIPDKPVEETPKEYSERIMRGELKDDEGK